MELSRISFKSKKVETAATAYPRPAHLEGALERILNSGARHFLASLHLRFGSGQAELLARRRARRARWRSGEEPGFLPETAAIRERPWKVPPAPRHLRRRHVEITGPAEAKMMINALNSGADVFMADLEDSLSPTWENVVLAQVNLKEAAAGTLTHVADSGKTYAQGSSHATLVVRPRGWHLSEENFLVNGEPIPAALFDFGLYFYHCAKLLLKEGRSGPYFYLPKLESHLEARLWNEIFVYAQHALGIPVGTIRATVLIETMPAAFEMDEILFELGDHAAGLNAGRWDYLFSFLKNLPVPARPYPERARLTMQLGFLRSYCEMLVQTCHRRGAHAIGGMAAFIPTRKDPAVNEAAIQKVRADKDRELNLGFDGTWVAHPDLVPVVKQQFLAKLRGADHQKDYLPEGIVAPSSLLPTELPSGISEEGVRTNLYVTLRYLHSWLNGQGAVAINHLMEDAATAEISRSQVWQWARQNAELSDGSHLNSERVRDLLLEELTRLSSEELLTLPRRVELQELALGLFLGEEPPEFLTIPAYEILLRQERRENQQQPEAL